MASELLASSRRLADGELVSRIKDLATRERGTMVLLVAHLAELDTRDFHLRAGHGSLFAFCRDALALSEQDAYGRIAVARVARRFPMVLDLLEAGAVNLTSVRLLAPRLTADNHREALLSARGKSKLQVEELAARLWPRPDVRSFVRRLPPPSRPAAPPLEAEVGARPPAGPPPFPGPAPAMPPSVVASSVPSPGPPREAPALLANHAPANVPSGPPPAWIPRSPSAEVTPLAPDRYKVQVTISGATLEKLRRAKDLLRHAIPSGDEAAILDRALTALLAAIARRKFAATEKPRAASPPGPGSRHIPAEVRRAVWRRDLGRCAFVGKSGRRCGERGFLEFHHVRPYAAGGEATQKNIELRCRSHNDYEARVYFAPARTSPPVGSPPLARTDSTTPSGSSRPRS